MTEAAYALHLVSVFNTSASRALLWREEGTTNFDTYILDDCFVYEMYPTQAIRVCRTRTSNVIVKVVPSAESQSYSGQGACARIDNPLNPTSGLFAFRYLGQIHLYELAGGSTWTQRAASTSNPYVAGAAIEIRVSGTTAQLYYNNTQVGSNATVGASTGRYHGYYLPWSGNSLGILTITAQ
jgi:hypothetical protein